MVHLLWALPLLMLIGCAIPEQRAAEFARSLETEFGPACAAMGHALGTDAYQACKMSLRKEQGAGDRAASVKAKM